MPKYGAAIPIRFPSDLESALKAEAARRGCYLADLVRDLVCKGLSEQAAVEGRAALQEAIRRAIKPTEERLAKLAVRAAMDAGTALLLNYSVLEEVAKVDALEYYRAARKKSAAWLRQPPDDES